jgi:hypothetical protein
MDPHLEAAEIWPGFHHGLAEEIVHQLNPRIGPKYYADVSVRTVGETVTIGAAHVSYPDVGVFERGGTVPASGAGRAAAVIPPAPVQRAAPLSGQTKLRAVHVYLAGTDQLVTTIEVLSPFNKRRGEGIDEYRAKRARTLNSTTHLIEVDLLRGGDRPGAEVADPPLDCDYVLLVNRFRADAPRLSDIWPVSLNESLPLLPVPLLSSDPDVALDLGGAARAAYAGRGYGWRIDYTKPVPPPPLRPEMARWVAEHVRA